MQCETASQKLVSKYRFQGQLAHNINVVGSQLSDCCVEGSHSESIFLSSWHRLGVEGLGQLGGHELIVLLSSLAQHQHLLQQALQLQHAAMRSSLRARTCMHMHIQGWSAEACSYLPAIFTHPFEVNTLEM